MGMSKRLRPNFSPTELEFCILSFWTNPPSDYEYNPMDEDLSLKHSHPAHGTTPCVSLEASVGFLFDYFD